ncbi:MAG: LytR C-terminal domain-containing protein, partial [Desulfobacterales bacterium]|nr:LytR C-terminal domain-containing protein [Desulfobacterales bacterium]
FRLEISNGNGVKYAARKVGSYLREKGFRVSQLTDASHFNFSESKIYYSSGHFQDALQLAQTIPGFQKFKNIIQFNKMNNKIQVVVVLGKDLVPFIKRFPLEENINNRTFVVKNKK